MKKIVVIALLFIAVVAWGQTGPQSIYDGGYQWAVEARYMGNTASDWQDVLATVKGTSIIVNIVSDQAKRLIQRGLEQWSEYQFYVGEVYLIVIFSIELDINYVVAVRITRGGYWGSGIAWEYEIGRLF